MDRREQALEHNIESIKTAINTIKIDVSVIKSDLEVIKKLIREREVREKRILQGQIKEQEKGWFFSY